VKRVDHAEASSKFIEAKDHAEFHDKRLWDLRKKRDRESELLPEWQELRALASAIKEHTLSNLAGYLEEFERNASANGMVVHWARDAAEHNQVVYEILQSHRVDTLVKSKSMLTDECEMRPFLAKRGITIIETDLGERIQQLDDEPPSHIVVPAVHKLRADVAEVFGRTIGTDPANYDIPYLAESQRGHTRPTDDERPYSCTRNDEPHLKPTVERRTPYEAAGHGTSSWQATRIGIHHVEHQTQTENAKRTAPVLRHEPRVEERRHPEKQRHRHGDGPQTRR